MIYEKRGPSLCRVVTYLGRFLLTETTILFLCCSIYSTSTNSFANFGEETVVTTHRDAFECATKCTLS